MAKSSGTHGSEEIPREISPRQRWLARLALAAMLAIVALLIASGVVASLAALIVGLAGLAVMCAMAWAFVAYRGARRWIALCVLIAVPLAVIGVYIAVGLFWEIALCIALAAVAIAAAHAARPTGGRKAAKSLEHPAAPVTRAYLIMNPRSGGGKVERFGLHERAAALGAEVALLEGPGEVDVAELARQAVRGGADLLGVAGGDGTQALVAGVASAHGVPLLVISAGTRNHFAMDLGLDRDDPSRCLDALRHGVELRIDLGLIGDRPFVNNASFGAYAEVVQSPAYRDDKAGTALRMLPDLISGHRGAQLEVKVGGSVVLAGPQAVLVSNNPYETGDIAGLSRRARLDRGVLGVIGVKVGSGTQAAALLTRHGQAQGLVRFAATEVVVDADAPQIPVGIDGESVLMPTPVRCTIRPQALRVLVPSDRPGVPELPDSTHWTQLGREALTFSRSR